MRPLKGLVSGSAAAAALFALLLLRPGTTTSQTPPPPRGEVHGYVSVPYTTGPARLPGAFVRLRNVNTGAFGPVVTTNAHGWFDTPRHVAGSYQVCGSAPGFVPQCDPEVVTLVNETFVLAEDFELAPPLRSTHGQVLLGDGTPCYGESLRAEPLERTRISILDPDSGSVVAGPVTANSHGDFVVPATPAGRALVLAECGGSHAVRSIDFSRDTGAAGSAITLRFGNKRPRISSTNVTNSAGVVVRYPDAGDVVTVTVNANDPDDDPLHYAWTAGSGEIISCDMPSIEWRLPQTNALNALYVRVTDGRGGVATASARVPTGAAPQFSGTIVDANTSLPLANATVSVNSGTPMQTRVNGAFLLQAIPTSRYVLNVTLRGYAASSQVFPDSRTQLVVPLSPATRFICNPGQPCSGSQRGEIGGMTLAIPPGALVNAAGNGATVPVRIDIFAYDLTQPNAIPGQNELTGLNDGRMVGLTSFGAFSVDATDAAGQRYNLRPGMLARATLIAQVGGGRTRRRAVRSNATETRNRKAPETIPLWRYHEATGIWRRAGGVGRLNTSGSYELDIPTFSAWNADLEFTTASCLHVTVDETKTSYPFKARFDIGGTIVEQTVTDKDNILRLLPTNTAVTLEIHPSFGPDAILKTYSLNTGPATSDLFPLDYNDCHGFELGTLSNPVVIALDGLPASHDELWLTKKTFVSGGTTPAAESVAYYTNIGAFATKNTLTDWKNANGFPAGEVTAAYYNAADLGFGRQMHCRHNGANVACYVTNFGTGPGGSADIAVDRASTNTSPIATVAMEYTPPAGSPNSVKFYVYNGAGALVTDAELDSEGPKPVPFICLVCHGGDYVDSLSAIDPASVIGASFREFDVFTFLYHPTNTAFQLPAQQEKFRQLNAMVHATQPAFSNTNQPITTLIDNMYSGTLLTPGTQAVDTYVPTDWNTKPALYTDIPREFCRACHIAQGSSLDWTKLSQFITFKNSIAYDVCTAKVMPHAEVPFKKFWFSGAPAYLADGGTGIGVPIGGCPP